MNGEEIKKAIKALPDGEIEPLLNWLGDYLNGEVWDRQMASDIDRFSPDGWMEALQQGMVEANEKRQAAVRLMNAIQFHSTADREQCRKDFELVIGQSLDGSDDDVPFGSLYDGPLPPDTRPSP